MRTTVMNTRIAAVFVLFALPSAATGQDEVQRLINPTPKGEKIFNWMRIAVDGDTIAISSEHSSLFPDYQPLGGIIHTFRRESGTWSLEDSILSPVLAPHDSFGNHIALKGDTLVARSHRNSVNDDPQGLFVFQRAGQDWSLLQEVISIGRPSNGRANSLAIAEDSILAGTMEQPGAPAGSGSVAVLEFENGQWTETGRLPSGALEADDGFGSAVAAHGSWCVVGSVDFGPTDSGAAFIFRFDGEQWQLHQTITAPDASINAEFGCAVAIHDELIAVNDCDVQPDGATYVYRLDTGPMTWHLESELESDADVPALYELAVGDDLIVTGWADSWWPAFVLYRFDGVNWIESYALNCGIEDCSRQVPPRANATFAVTDDYVVAGALQSGDLLTINSRDYLGIVGPAKAHSDCNGNLLDDTFEIAIGNPDCNGNGVPDECEAGDIGDCNGNGICDAYEIATGEVYDCNDNGVIDHACETFDVDTDGDGAPDECDNCVDLYNPDQHDCDNDGVGDLCAIDSGLADDCNHDGIPDFCQDDYVLDSGAVRSFWIGNGSDYDCLCIQQFGVRAGREIVNGIQIHWSMSARRPSTLLLYRDPNNDGDPNDAELLWQQDVVSATVRDGYVAYPVDDVFVGHAGQTYFVAVMSTGHLFPASEGLFDGGEPGRWLAADNIGEFDPTDLSKLAIAPPLFQYGGPWMIRASASPQDACNCTADIAGSRGRGADGVVNALDLMQLLDSWGDCGEPCPPSCAADLTGNCAVDVFDLFVLLQQWGACE